MCVRVCVCVLQLAKEIVHDLKQAELQAKQQQATQVANQAAEQARPAHRGPVAAGQTPLAAEVLASGGARTAARIAGAGRRVSMQGLEQAAGPSSQPTTPGAALRAGAGAAGAATPGAALLRSARSPHSLGAARTPGTGLRHPASAGGAAGGGLTPAPVSAARAADAARKTAAAEAKRNQRRVVIASDEEEDDDTDQVCVCVYRSFACCMSSCTFACRPSLSVHVYAILTLCVVCVSVCTTGNRGAPRHRHSLTAPPRAPLERAAPNRQTHQVETQLQQTVLRTHTASRTSVTTASS